MPQSGGSALIAVLIASELVHPKPAVCLGHGRACAACVCVPIASVDKEGPPPPAIRDVWPTGKAGDVDTKAESRTMESRPDRDLRRCIEVTDRRHPRGPLRRA